jgi:GntR family transcriptional regulator, arabinose operon transcriptional repressor
MANLSENGSFKYMAMAHELRRHIAVAALQPGDRLPTEDELVRQHAVSRITIRRALAMLEQDGLVSRKRKLGTFVSRALEHPSDLHMVRGVVLVLIGSSLDVVGEEDHALSTVLRGLEHYLADLGFSVQIMSIGRNEQQDQARLIQTVARHRIEGICSIGTCPDSCRTSAGNVPLVTACTFVPHPKPWVGMSIEDATYLGVGRMLEVGHQQVAVVCGPWVDSPALRAFADGARAAHREHQIEFHPSLLYHAFDEASLQELAMELLSAPQRPTGIFCEDWRVCRAVVNAASRLELKIPQQLSLVGCGQNIQYLNAPCAITAYVPDSERVGREIGRVLVEIVDSGAVPADPVVVSGRLVEGESVAPPGGKGA